MELPNALQEAIESCETLEHINVDSLVDKRVSPGMLVIAPPMRLLHMNQKAWDLLRNIGEAEHKGNGQAKPAKGLLPKSLQQVCTEIFQHLKDITHAKDWERLEIKRLIGGPKYPVLIRGFGVPDQGAGREQSRVVLLLEAIGRRKEEINEETKERFQFTEREQAVVQCLAKGWTNKEIANALNLALPTVKEHIRHIMEKTKTTTRTGILVQVFRM